MAVLLVVLWMQSYWWYNHAQCILPNNRVMALMTAQGVVSVFGGTYDNPMPKAVTSGVSATEITWEEDYWQSDHWDFEFSENFKEVKVPLWFLVAMCGVISALPWLPWKGRYSLRTLLIATTLLGFSLGPSSL
jgi:hypothetical protein